MLSREENELLTKVGHGTPMSELLRRYWYPIAASAELIEKPTKAVRVLGEDLVLYRDKQGRPGLIGSQCAHRRMSLILGIPEKDGLRCPYHGWLYDRSGKCLEQPYEQAEDPDSRFKDRIHMPAYPVEELGGLIFAYLGPQPAPLLPRWELFVRDGVLRDIGAAVIPCNWLQIMENSLDPVHVEWLHQYFSNYAMERIGRPGDEKTNDPNYWRIHALYWWYQVHPKRAGDADQRPEDIPIYKVPLPGVDAEGVPIWDIMDNNSGQDNFAWSSQGPITPRWTEHLGESDKGLILYRRLLREQMQIVEDGGDPMNTFRDPAKNVSVHVPTESDDPNWQGYQDNRQAAAGQSVGTGQAIKYSP